MDSEYVFKYLVSFVLIVLEYNLSKVFKILQKYFFEKLKSFTFITNV